MEIGYVISSHIKYIKPLLRLVESMYTCEVSNNQIFIAVGGSDVLSIGRTLHYTNHNSFDFTGLIEFVQQDTWIPEYVMTLQDTMEFTELTHELVVSGIDTTKDAIAVFGGQCNLVLYRRDYLLEMRDFILSRKNMSKLQSIQEEGILWRMLPDDRRGHYINGSMDVLSFEALRYPYGTNIPRIVERYNAIQLLKYKANYGQNMHNLITEP